MVCALFSTINLILLSILEPENGTKHFNRRNCRGVGRRSSQRLRFAPLDLMGVEAIDPMASRKADPKLRAHPFARNSANKNSSKNEASAPGLSAEDVRLVKWVKDQHSRRGGFVRIFPRAETWSAYGGLLDYKTHTNELLAMRLFPETYRACTAVVRSKLTEGTFFQFFQLF